MKSIQRKDFVPAGRILKSHGTQGELKVFTPYDLHEWAFLEIQGKPVPFKILRFQFVQPEEALIQLAGIDTVQDAQGLQGLQLLVPSASELEHELDDSVVGYALQDETYGPLGLVEELLELPMQLLFRTTYRDNELLIPAVDAFIQDIDDEQKIIYLRLPEGFIEH